ncbi:hypothetical protein Nmel_012129 [Mimus melanotis]
MPLEQIHRGEPVAPSALAFLKQVVFLISRRTTWEGWMPTL